MALKSALLLALLVAPSVVASHKDLTGVVAGTEQVIGALRNESEAAHVRFSDASGFEEQLDEVGRRAESHFDEQRYSEKGQAFSKLASRAAKTARRALKSDNATTAEELSYEAEQLSDEMTTLDAALDGMEKDLRDGLHGALAAKLGPELGEAAKFGGEASHLQKEAHSMMDPLYSGGDAAEDKADRLNDQTNQALSAVDRVVRAYRRRVARHAREVQRRVEKKLLAGHDRRAEVRRVHRAVGAATFHVLELQTSADVGLLAVRLGSSAGLSALVAASAAAAVVGGLVAGLSLKARASRGNDYQLLAA